MSRFKSLFSFGKKEQPKAKSKRTLAMTNEHKDILTSLFSLPVRGEWLSHDEIEKIERDSTVTAAKGSRKAVTLKKEILITCDDETIKDELEATFSYETLDAMLDIPYQGFGCFEINWSEKEYILYPKIIERNYEDFVLDNGTLLFAGGGLPEEIPPYKSLYATYKAKPLQPYGQPLYQTLFWLINFKNASMQFWVELLERFGTPWVIGKTEGDKNEMAAEIYNMLGGDGAVLDTDDELDIVTAKDKGDFKEIIEYIDSQIAQVILGGNLTTQVQQGSKAAASVHADIREDLAKADETIVTKLIKQTVKFFKELNNISSDINVQLKDKDDPNKELADRDKVIYEMGFDLDEEYIKKTYNVEVKRREAQTPSVIPNSKMAFSKNIPQDELESQANNIDLTQVFTFQEQIVSVIENSSSFEEATEKLLELYPAVDTDDLQGSLEKYIANSMIYGKAQIEEENPNG